MRERSHQALKTQRKAFLGVVVGVCIVSAVILYLFTGKTKSTQSPSAVKITLPGDKINPQDMWMSKVSGENKVFDQRLKYLENLILETKKKEQKTELEKDALRGEVLKLKVELQNLQQKSTVSPLPLKAELAPHKAPGDPFVTPPKLAHLRIPSRPPLKELVMGKAKRTVLHVDQAIPAGTTVKAILVSSIDAPCAVYSATDPRPVKLRILDNGHLPKKVQARLKGGLVIATAYGDISTERVYMRLERLSQIEPSGEFVETEVTGFVSGEDGKYGVRGTVVDKSTKLVANAAASGFFSGVSQFLNTSLVASQSGKCCGNVPAGWNLLSDSAASGASNAFEALTDYYIKRAEQIVPVIEVTAGREVDITFTLKADLGDLYAKEKAQEIRERSRRVHE